MTDDTCPTCWQPVPRAVRGDHDYGIPLAARTPDVEALRDALDDALDLIADMAPDYHHNGLVRDHADPTDKTGWNVKGIETCEDPMCVAALRLQALITTLALPTTPEVLCQCGYGVPHYANPYRKATPETPR